MNTPTLKSRLNRIMLAEQQARTELIKTIINHKVELSPDTDVCALFDELHELNFNDLNAILNDLISDLWSSINATILASINKSK